MENISQHISWVEATKSATAIRYDINNIPDDECVQKMKVVAARVFEPLRRHFNCPIAIASFYRSKKVNRIIGGSPTSQHCKGEALDLDADVYGEITNKQIFDFILNNLEFDQLIWEFSNPDGSPAWVHVSYVDGANRGMVLKAEKHSGKTVYKKYDGKL
jgi:hypothetical protein